MLHSEHARSVLRSSGTQRLLFVLRWTLPCVVAATVGSAGLAQAPSRLPSGEDAAMLIAARQGNADLASQIVTTKDRAEPLTGVSLAKLRISSGFGRRPDPLVRGSRMHGGLDLPAAWGTTVRAAGSGIVRRAGWAGGYGNLIEIAHLDGTSTRYGHLSSILVQTGERVSAGQRIGGVGSTGRSTGPHLHFEVRRNGAPINPFDVPTYSVGDQYVTTWSTQQDVGERSGWASAGGDLLPSMQLNIRSSRAN